MPYTVNMRTSLFMFIVIVKYGLEKCIIFILYVRYKAMWSIFKISVERKLRSIENLLRGYIPSECIIMQNDVAQCYFDIVRLLLQALHAFIIYSLEFKCVWKMSFFRGGQNI